MGVILGTACGSEAAPWTAFPTLELDAGAFDFGSLRPPNRGARRGGADTSGAGAGGAVPPEIGTGAPEGRDASANTAGNGGTAGSMASGGEASDVADGGMGGSAGARTNEGRRRGPFDGWDGGWLDRRDPPEMDAGQATPGPDGGTDLADAEDAGGP